MRIGGGAWELVWDRFSSVTIDMHWMTLPLTVKLDVGKPLTFSKLKPVYSQAPDP